MPAEPTGSTTRFESALQSLAAQAVRFFPPPVEMQRLEPLRQVIAERIYAGRRSEVEASWKLFAQESRRPADAGAPYGGNAGLAAIARLASEMVATLRVEVAHTIPAEAEARDAWGRLLGLSARIDSALPTDEMEHMDDPAIDEDSRSGLIRALDRLNRLFGSYPRFLDALEPLLDGSKTTTVLDLASGHGGFPLALAALARSRGERLRVIASDLKPEYVAIGKQQAERIGETEVEFRVVDAFRLRDAVKPGEVDVITCTQSLHHFGPGPLAALIAVAVQNATRGVLLIDPVRALSRLVGVGAMSVIAARNRRFLHDGLVSIRKSFVPSEMGLIARCVPRGDRLESFYLAPGFVVLRTTTGGLCPPSLHGQSPRSLPPTAR